MRHHRSPHGGCLPDRPIARLEGKTSRFAVAGAVALLLALSATAVRSQDTASPQVQAFDRFITTSTPLCLYEAAAACIDAAWLMVDRDRNQLLSLDEATKTVEDLSDWARWKKPALHEKDWTGIQLGLLIVRTIGVDRLFDGFDADGDRGLSQGELLADITLDQRPLRDILTDRSAVDWDSVSRRLGSFAGLVNGGVSTD